MDAWRSVPPAYLYPWSVSVNPADGSCWMADKDGHKVVHCSAGGAELWRSASGAFSGPESVSVNPTDDSCWVADTSHGQVVHLSAAGAELWRGGAFNSPFSVSVDPTDGSCWVGDGWQVVHLSAAGAELWRSASGAFSIPLSVSVNPTDGSCWAADYENSQVVQLSAAGAELWRSASGAFSYPYSVSVNPTDGSCWVADAHTTQVVHLSAAGVELWRSASGASGSVSVNPIDGSCWVADNENFQVVHLSAAGVELWRSDSGAFGLPLSVSVNPTDGSCWVGFGGPGQVVHLSAAGAELWRSDSGAFYYPYPYSVSVNPTDGSCWVADAMNYQVVHLAVVGYGGAPDTVSFSTFESSRSPFSSFAAGSGEANTWRAPLTGDLTAHSGLYAMSSEVTGLGVTGLRLDLPTEPSGPAEVDLRAWAYVADRTEGDSSTFFGLVFAPEDLSPTVDPSMGLGWEVLTENASHYQLAGTTVDASDGLTAGRWHLVQVHYNRVANTLSVWLDGELLAEQAAPLAANRAAAYLVLGAYGESEAAHTQVLLDDVQVTLTDYSGPPAVDHPIALAEGPERVAESQTKTYTIAYGNGYPMLGLDDTTETLPQSLWVGASLPADYAFASADPAPSRIVAGVPVWELPLPALGQAGLIQLTANTPTGLAEAEVGRLWTWATTDPEASTTNPPAPPGYTIPLDAVWGLPQDALPQHIDLVPRPDVWVRKAGPRFASPGDTITYAITVGNTGEAAAEDIVVRDLMPSEMGGGDLILGNLAALEPGDTWEGVTSTVLPWGVPGGTLLLNTAYVPTGPMEIAGDNNTFEWTTTVQAARDPNEISVSPTGGTDRNLRLTYTLQCENTGAGTAYGVYATAKLDKNLNAATLLVADTGAVSYDPTSRTLVWEVGTLGASEGASTSFSVTVANTAKRARPVVGHATVYFPSVPEETPTNVVSNTVAGTFPDVAWDHWAVLPVELAYENGIVGGYDDGTYRPAVTVSRDQMAVFIARALAGGDSHVPSGPDTATFSDVATLFWAFKYIEYAQSHGVVGGYPDGTYRPAVPVDRGQMAVFVARALAGGDSAVPAPPATPTFPDVTPTSTWAWVQKHVEYTVARGVVSGYDDGTYRPATVCTRDQMAVFVARAFALPM